MYTFYKKHEYVLAAVLVLISQLFILPELKDYYPDTDNYTHARRVLDLIESGIWAEKPYIYSNYPFGEILHFTRITDVFWLFFSLPAFLFFSVKNAVFWGGCIYQTGVLMLSAVALVWALKPVASPLLRLVGLCVFFIQPSVTETYILIKPDHHVLTAFFTFILLGGITHYLSGKQPKYLRIAGIGAGLCLWSSVEGLLISYTVLASIILLFLLNKESIKAGVVYFFYYFISSSAFLAVDPPYEGFFFPDNGRLSFLLITMIGLTTVALIVLYLWEEKKRPIGFTGKFFSLIATTAFFIALLFLVFPKSVIFAPHFPPEIKEIWANNVIELQPGLKNIVLFFLGSWPSVLSLLTGLIIFKFCSPLQRSFLILTLIPLIFFTGFSFAWIRYSRLSSLFTPIPLVLAFSLRLNRMTFSDRKIGFLITVLYFCAALYLGINYRAVNQAITYKPRPSLLGIKPYLSQKEGSILADTSLGPEIIWTLDEKVIGTPYHRNVEGIMDGVYTFHSNNREQALELLEKHRVKAILLFVEIPDQPELFYNIDQRYSFFKKSNKKDSLFLQLLFGKDLPCGITEELNTPPPYILYNVDFSKCSREYRNTADILPETP